MYDHLGGVSVDPKTARSYFTSEWAVAGSHVIEPTGPMMGPNAVADVMPLGGRQTLRRGCQAFSLGFNNPLRCRFTRAPVFSEIGVFLCSRQFSVPSRQKECYSTSCLRHSSVTVSKPSNY